MNSTENIARIRCGPSIKDVGVQDTLAHRLVSRDLSMRSAESLVFDAVAVCRDGVDAKASNISIIESLAWIFISYRSRKPDWFPKKTLRRFHRSLKNTYERIKEFANDDYREYSYVKYWLDTLLCRLAKDPSLPERKEWNTKPLFTGYLKRIVDKAIYRQNRGDQMLILSLQKGSKKMWANIKDEKVLRKKDLEFKSRLVQPRPNVSATLNTFILQSSREVFKPLIDHKMHLSGAIPSNRACWESSVQSGGAQALFSPLRLPPTIFPAPVDVVHIRQKATQKRPGSLLITRPRLETNSSCAFEVNFDDVESKHSDMPDPSDQKHAALEMAPFGILRTLQYNLSNYLQDTFESALHGAETQTENSLRYLPYEGTGIDELQRLPMAEKYPALTTNKVARIAEAGGKIRYVSAGSGQGYTALRPLQSCMLKCWKRMPESTMLNDDLLSDVQKIDRNVKLPYWCSVDYEAATDLLNRDATYRVLTALMEGAVPTVKLAWESFGPGIMILPDKTSFVHVEGQLMGHVLSFPMLCVINRAVIHATVSRWILEGPSKMEPWGNKLLSRTKAGLILLRNIKINGDDMVFKCTKDLYHIFLKVCGEVGFKISQGKNYLSENFCMINSQFYCRHNGTMERIGYLNLQLVKGFSSKKGESDATPDQIGTSMNKMIELCPWAQCTIPAAMKTAEKKLSNCSVSVMKSAVGTTRAWYGPQALGAFGLDLKYAPKSWTPTRSQRKLAAMMRSDERMGFYSQQRMAPRTMSMISRFIHPHLVYRSDIQGPVTKDGNYPMVGFAEDFSKNKWFSRLLFMAQAASPPFIGDPMISALKTFKPEHRLKPMSVRKFMSTEPPQVQAVPAPDCPPLPLLLIREFQPSQYIASDEELSLADTSPLDGWYPNF